MEPSLNQLSAPRDHAANASARIHSLVVSAAHSAETGGAVLVLLRDGRFKVPARFGPSGKTFAAPDAICTKLLAEAYGLGANGG